MKNDILSSIVKLLGVISIFVGISDGSKLGQKIFNNIDYESQIFKALSWVDITEHGFVSLMSVSIQLGLEA